jgi:transcriptional regulator with XRE-family HTH domain
MGERIRLARLRRGLSAEKVAERAGVSRPTLSALENGASGVSTGTLLQVLMVLGLENDMAYLAKDDAFGRRLQDAGLNVRAGSKRRKKDR